MWSQIEWKLFKYFLTTTLKETDCILVFDNEIQLRCNLKNIDLEASSKEMWVNNIESSSPILINLVKLIRIIRLN
jgi:hypothetical protein